MNENYLQNKKCTRLDIGCINVKKRGNFMIPCNCYCIKYHNCDTLTEKINIPCQRAQFNFAVLWGKNYNGVGEVFYDCPNCKKCHLELGLPFRKYKSSNMIINDFGGGKCEFIIYDKPFYVIDDYVNLEKTNNSKNYRKIDTEYGKLLVPKNEDIRDSKLYTSVSNCSKRAQDNYYGIALSNKWKYFATFTIAPQYCDRYNDYEVKELWRLSRMSLTKKYLDLQYLCVPERHKDGALHFHALLNTEYDIPLKPYIENGIQQVTSTGALLYLFDSWKYSISTLAVIPPEDNQSAVINYLIAYTTKQSNLGWGQRRFFASRNLLRKTKLTDYTTTPEDIADMYDLELYKIIKGKGVVFRNFNIDPNRDNKKSSTEFNGSVIKNIVME